MAQANRDALADPVGTPGHTPDADMREPSSADRKRDGVLGGFLVAGLPALILLMGLAMWWTNIGTTADAIDPPVVVGEPATGG